MGLKHPVVYGHPLHAILSDLPAALIPTALLAAAAERVRPTDKTRFAAQSASALALTSALMAAAFGWWDWVFVPRDHPARRPATIHGLLNTAGLGLGALALVTPRRRLELLIGLNAVLGVAAWMGGDLVYRLGWRVRPAEELEQIEQGKSPQEAKAVIDKHEREDLLLSRQ